MFITINNLQINYHASGTGKNIILLHGWGAQISSFKPVHQYLENNLRVYSLDLPGFGKSDPPPESWGTAEYTHLVQQFIHELGIKNPIIMGHSFGGRIAIRLALIETIHKLILVDSAGIKPKRKLNYYLKVYAYKLLKNVAQLPILKHVFKKMLESVQKKAGSKDYQNASGVMRTTLIKVVNEDLTELLPQIKAPTLLMWGENDQATPVSDGQLMEQLIPDAGLVVLKNAGHFSYLDKLNEFLLIISSFLKDDMNQ
ncbi:MAG: alpha/beta hydrolase [Candidatus Parabeggiatoa sp. nov. 1]|nr:MAG: alpha/beta hydrolase [Gammaproteobacteria bacterium]